MKNRSKLVLKTVVCAALLSAAVLCAQELPQTDEGEYTLPELAIDAERSSYRALISREQDEISSERMQMLPTKNPAEMLRSQNSSVTLGGGLGGVINTIALRGLESKYTNVTLDGASVNTPWNWSSPLSGFPQSRLKKITVAPSGNALVYGQNAVAGSVNFVLPEAKDNMGLTLTQEYGGKGISRQEYMFGFEIGGSEHLAAFFSDDYDGQRVMKNGYAFSDRSDNITIYYKGKFKLADNLSFKSTLLNCNGSLSLADAFRAPGGLRFEPWKMSLYTHSLEKQFNNDSSLIFRFSKYNDFSTNVEYDNPEMTLGRNVGGSTNVDMKTYDIIYNFKANDKHYINIGAQKQETVDSHESVSKDFFGKKHKNASYFAADSIKAADKLNLHLSARLDENYEDKKDTSFALNSSYQLFDNTSIGLGFSRTFMQPTLQDLYIAKEKKKKCDLWGNPNLKNEKADCLELRLSHRFSDRWAINAAGYKYDIDDRIVNTTAKNMGVAGQAAWYSTNKGGKLKFNPNDTIKTNAEKAKINGIEFAVNGSINDNFDTWCSYTRFAKSEYRVKGVTYDLQDVPEFRAVWGLQYNRDKTSALLTVSHQGEMKALKSADNVTYPRVKPSTIADFTLKEQFTSNMSMYVRVYNIGNAKNAVLNQKYLNKSTLGTKGIVNEYTLERERTVIMGMELTY